MYATIPVYYPSLEEAARKDEAALWCDSYNINMSCRNFIQDKAMTAFNTRELDAFIEELVRCYGTERAMYVLSRTIQFSDWDARFDQAVLDRAGKTDFPDTREPREAHQVDPTTRYVTEIDPCVVNAVFVKLMELEDEQEETNHMNGDGETVRADEEDLAFFREHFDELDASDALDCISDHSFSFESDELDFGYGEESEDEEDLEL